MPPAGMTENTACERCAITPWYLSALQPPFALGVRSRCHGRQGRTLFLISQSPIRYTRPKYCEI